MFVYMCKYSNTFFQGRLYPLLSSQPTAYFFTTHFLICHSFLDFLYMCIFPPSGEIDCPGVR